MTSAARRVTTIVVHPLTVRVTHWVNAFAIVCMVMSGWGIYNATPLFGFSFPRWATLGGWLGGSTIWHFAAMWLLVANGVVYVGYGLLSQHFRHVLLPLHPRAIWGDFSAALRLRLTHHVGVYNAVQRLLYVVVLLLLLLVVLSGLELWKPVQFQAIGDLMGGYEVARRVHFLAMAGIVGFTMIHILLVILVPRTLPSMITGRARVSAAEASS